MFKHFRVKLLVLTLSLISLENLAQETETRKLPHFESITSRANIDVVIAYGEEHAARIETQNIPAEMIVTEVENETLFISLKGMRASPHSPTTSSAIRPSRVQAHG